MYLQHIGLFLTSPSTRGRFWYEATRLRYLQGRNIGCIISWTGKTCPHAPVTSRDFVEIFPEVGCAYVLANSYSYLRVSQNVTAYYHLPSRLCHTTHRLDWEIGVTWYCVLFYYIFFFHDNLLIIRLMTCIYASLFRHWRCVNASLNQRYCRQNRSCLKQVPRISLQSGQSWGGVWIKVLPILRSWVSLSLSLCSIKIDSSIIIPRRRSGIVQNSLCHEIQYAIVALDYWTAVRCWMVVQEAARVFSPSRMAWSAWVVACPTICSCRYVFLFPCAGTMQSGNRSKTLPCGFLMNSRSIMLMSPHVSNTRACIRFRLFYFPFLSLFLNTQLVYYYFPGSVSVGVWQIACRRLIVVGEKAVKSFAGKLNPVVWVLFLLKRHQNLDY